MLNRTLSGVWLTSDLGVDTFRSRGDRLTFLGVDVTFFFGFIFTPSHAITSSELGKDSLQVLNTSPKLTGHPYYQWDLMDKTGQKSGIKTCTNLCTGWPDCKKMVQK